MVAYLRTEFRAGSGTTSVITSELLRPPSGWHARRTELGLHITIERWLVSTLSAQTESRGSVEVGLRASKEVLAELGDRVLHVAASPDGGDQARPPQHGRVLAGTAERDP